MKNKLWILGGIFLLGVVMLMGIASGANEKAQENSKACDHASEKGKKMASSNSVLAGCSDTFNSCVDFALHILSLRSEDGSKDFCGSYYPRYFTDHNVCAETERYGWACVYDESTIKNANHPEHGYVIGFSKVFGSASRYDGALGPAVDTYYFLGGPDTYPYGYTDFAVFCWENPVSIC